MDNTSTRSISAVGSILAHGGGNIEKDSEFKKRFIELAGGTGAKLVYIPTAFSDEQLAGNKRKHLDPDFVQKQFGYNSVAVLHTRDRGEAGSDAFVQSIKDANAVFLTGGRQWRLADAYLGTQSHEELKNLLLRGGVVGGSSAGATILASLLVRGNADPDDNTILVGDHREGFGFLQNMAIDQHLLPQNRQYDMFGVIRQFPQILGIGIDVNTTVHVQGAVMTVFGSSCVAVYDGESITSYSDSPGESDLRLLFHGERYDLLKRKPLV